MIMTLEDTTRRIKRALLIQVPGFDGERIKFIPYGLLAVGTILKKRGIEVDIYDLCIENEEGVEKLAKEKKPCLIGFGGIATSYGAAKSLSYLLKKYCPNSVYVAGGPLASTYEILLEDGIVDYVFHGETEISLPKFINFLETNRGLASIGGISFLRKRLTDIDLKIDSIAWFKQNDLVVRTHPEKQLENLDECGFPDYSLIDLNKYVLDLRERYAVYKHGMEQIYAVKSKVDRLIKQNKYRFIEVLASRGCTNRCKFCYRHVRGIRRFSVEYVIDHLKLLKEHCNIDGVSFCDELFNNNVRWVYDLCDMLQKSHPDLSFYMAAGMRASRIDENLIKRMSEVGFITMNFGHESGSDIVLKYYEKGVTVRQNIESVALTKKYGVHTCLQLVIGSPVETMDTIKQTNNFLKVTDAVEASINYIIPFPETPIWEEVVKNGFIRDVREYLNRVRKYAGSYYMGLNLSKANKILWIFWYVFLERTVMLNRYKHNFLKKMYYKSYLFKLIHLLRNFPSLLFTGYRFN